MSALERRNALPLAQSRQHLTQRKNDLNEARRLIEKHGYWRRKEELEDAEQVIGK